MSDTQRLVGVFRERRQAELAMAAARRQGLHVPEAGDLVEDSDGVQVTLGTVGSVDHARRLLLDYGAYRVVVS